jgi:hypothetical protein
MFDLNVKLIASQARAIFQYKNTRVEVLKCCANIYFNKQCLIKRIRKVEKVDNFNNY